MSEFSIIKKYFANAGVKRSEVILGIGDDAALVQSNSVLAISVDTLVENVHFPSSTSAFDIGWKSLAVNISDMAAMGATPCWMTLALTLPSSDETWLNQFSEGLSQLANQYDIALIGGDTTRGPLSITIQITGTLDNNEALRRSAANVGDRIFVTGTLGDAALGLESLQETMNLSGSELQFIQCKLNRPEPRLKEIHCLKEFVNAAIDISDGLHADLDHILEASGVGAVVNVQNIPVSQEYRWCCQGEQAFELALTGGDDYELCLTVPEEHKQRFLDTAKNNDIKVTEIGEVTEQKELILLDKNDKIFTLHSAAYDHFG